MVKRVSISAGGYMIPEWKVIQPGMSPIKRGDMTRGYERLLWEAESYVRNEVANKALAVEFIKYCAKEFDKVAAAELKKLPDYAFATIGKYTYMANRGVGLSQDIKEQIQVVFERLLKQAATYQAQDDETETAPTVTVSVQERMREQLATLLGDIEAEFDKWPNIKVAEFDPNKMFKSYDVEIKPAHAKMIRDQFAAGAAEAAVVVEFVDEDVREAYAHTNARQRKALADMYEKLNMACDAITNQGKAERKPRKPKAVSKDKLVQRVKYKASEPTLGLASVNPVSLIGANTVWVYNTKTRKLGQYVADSMTGPITVKGAGLVGFDESKSVQKTIRKPELLKGANKLARTKIQKLFDDIRATDTKMNGRFNEHTVIVSVF